LSILRLCGEVEVKKSSVYLAAVVLAFGALSAACSAGAATYNFTYTGSGVSASGVITTSGTPINNIWPCPTCVSTGEVATGISGQVNGEAIIGLLAPGMLFGNNNAIYSQAPYLDWGDLGFATASHTYDVFNGDYTGHIGNFQAIDTMIASQIYSIPVTFTLSAAPEPATWALMVLAVGGMGANLRTRRRKIAA
jgi:hypothetical protein